MTEVSPCDEEYISTVFLVPKKTGDFRPVINLKSECPEKSKIACKFQNFKIAQTLAISGPY